MPAKRGITIRDLLTHTAGISYGTSAPVASQYEAKGLGPAAGFGWYTADKEEPICDTMTLLGTLPFVAQPGDAWVYGGKISARYIHPVYAGDKLTATGLVTEIAEVDGKPRVSVQIWCENQDGRKTSAGTASAGQPSDKRSWIAKEAA